jgi:sulfoxide reductase heme-binding subunit YedZ
VPWLKPAIVTGAFMPLVALAIRGAQGTLAADPIAQVLNQLGLLTLIFLIATLTMTPLRVLFGWTWPIRIRRTLGLIAFTYAALHFLTYVAIDQRFDWPVLWKDVTQRLFIIFGFAAFLLLIPLAVTSTSGWVRRLGIQRWQRLHRLVYVAAALGALHFIWRVKSDLTEPAIYTAIIGALLAFRAVRAMRTRAEKRAPVSARSKLNAQGSELTARTPGAEP